ncbi:hypothetical protein [Desulfovibrio sp. SGI.169]|uniref:hypothetical protein n=1 Tax=Desulfovibrio sp. SGI.169 TaxID=3420561 RepID=UPI003CFBF968
MKKLEEALVSMGKKKFDHPEDNAVHIIEVEPEAQKLIEDLQNYPHAYVFSCLMDRQISAKKAWEIPYKIKCSLKIKTFDINELSKISKQEYIDLFTKEKLHRFCRGMAEIFYDGIQRIITQYEGDASKIWSGEPSSSKVVYNFLQFNGCGIKIATMATNILARQYRIKYSDYMSVDVSPDVHVRRTMTRLGLIPKNIKLSNGKDDINKINELIIYKAREIHPSYPGIIDYSLWNIGRDLCHPNNPDCAKCELSMYCLYHKNNNCMV